MSSLEVIEVYEDEHPFADECPAEDLIRVEYYGTILDEVLFAEFWDVSNESVFDEDEYKVYYVGSREVLDGDVKKMEELANHYKGDE